METSEGSTVEDLIKDIQERTGLPAEKVLEVVTMVTDYLKNALPDDLVAQITQHLSNAAERASGAAASASSTAASSASAAVGMASGVASSAFAVARDTVTNALNDTRE
jgi:hypothetical protein